MNHWYMRFIFLSVLLVTVVVGFWGSGNHNKETSYQSTKVVSPVMNEHVTQISQESIKLPKAKMVTENSAVFNKPVSDEAISNSVSSVDQHSPDQDEIDKSRVEHELELVQMYKHRSQSLPAIAETNRHFEPRIAD